MANDIPEKYLDLFEKKAFASLATLMPDGRPQVTPVWVDFDGSHVIVNTAKGRQKDRNMRADPRVSLAIIDPDNPTIILYAAEISAKLGNYSKAEYYYNKVLPTELSEEAYVELSRMLIQTNNYKKSQNISEQGLKIFPNNATLWEILAMSEYKLHIINESKYARK